MSIWKSRIFQLAKYMTSSAIGTVVDYCFFSLVLFGFGVSKEVAFVVGKVSGAIANFLINKYVVFKDNRSNPGQFAAATAKYALLWVAMSGGSYALFHLFVKNFGIFELWARMMGDGCMYVIGFLTQKYLIFNKMRKETIQ